MNYDNEVYWIFSQFSSQHLHTITNGETEKRRAERNNTVTDRAAVCRVTLTLPRLILQPIQNVQLRHLRGPHLL